MQSQATRMYRVKAVAEMFDVSASTIYRAIEAGKLDALQIGGGNGAIRIPEHALQRFVEESAEDAYQTFVLGSKSAATADQAGDAMSGEVL